MTLASTKMVFLLLLLMCFHCYGNSVSIDLQWGKWKLAFIAISTQIFSQKFFRNISWVVLHQTITLSQNLSIWLVVMATKRLNFFCFFSSPEPSGSQGELIVYPYSGVRCRCRRQQCLNIFSSETALPVKAKFYVEPPWEGGTKVYINGPGHMTKMAAMTIYGKNL